MTQESPSSCTASNNNLENNYFIIGLMIKISDFGGRIGGKSCNTSLRKMYITKKITNNWQYFL